MKKFKGLMSAILVATLVTSFSGAALAQAPNAAPATPQVSNNNPAVVLEALDRSGKQAPGAMVTIKSLTDGGSVVFQGKTDATGRVHFTSAMPGRAAETPGNVADAVYEAFIVAPGGEIQVKTFSVQHVKDMSILSDTEKREHLKDRLQHLKVQLNANADEMRNATDEGGLSTLALGCTSLGYDSTVCVEDERTTSENTKVGLVHVANGEQVEFNMTSTSKVSLQAGIKTAEGSPWSVDTSYSLSTETSTGVDYTFSGTCIYSGGAGYCNNGRYQYVYYGFLYQKKSYYYKGGYLRSEWTVKPTGLTGSSSRYEWFYDSRNGKPVADVQNNVYGAKFEIFNGGSTTKSYTTERTFSVASEVPTPVGTFYAGLTTQYANKATIKWSTTGSTRFWHYDYNTAGGDYYVTF